MPSQQFPLESLLSARQLVSAKLHNDKIIFMSNIAGSYSLYEINKNGSIPVPLLPEGTALQNPHLMAGANFEIIPEMNKILVMIDQNGNELYQPCLIPIEGGIPESIFNERFSGMQVILNYFDHEKNIVYFAIDNRKEPGYELIKYNLLTKKEESFGKSQFGYYYAGGNKEHSKIVLVEGYTAGDDCYYLHQTNEMKTIIGIPINERKPGQIVKPNGLGEATFVENDSIVLLKTIYRTDKGSVHWMNLNEPNNLHELEVKGLKLPDAELEEFTQIYENFFSALFNVDGTSHVYLLEYIPGKNRHLNVTQQIIGKPDTPLSNGVMLSKDYDHVKVHKEGKLSEIVVSFTKATSPSQLYLIQINGKDLTFTKISNEKILGIPEKYLSEGEDASFTSFDGLRISARLYRPSPELGFQGPRPLVHYVHGGPQGQERPDFTWFSMPLIQFLTLNGFTVFVPNVRGSTGYGLDYMKKVDKDWGGDDLKDQIEGLKFLEKDTNIDSTRRGVTGRSYGGYMTLSLVSRHPDLWKAGIDMFGPYDLIGFLKRLPPSWQVYFEISMGHPEKDKDFLNERSPKTYIDNIKAPLLVIQGANDPRVTLVESKEIVDHLRNQGKDAEILVFEDEGHDVIKFKNKVRCYSEMVDYFKKHLKP